MIFFLKGMGYQVTRQRGRHVRLEKVTPAGCHKITIPNHNPVARGTLNGILGKVALWNQTDKMSLIKKVTKQ